MAVNYLEDYLGIDPSDYSAMEQGIAGISPLSPEQSILPQAPVMPRASIMDEGDFASATAPLMGRVYQREAESRATATSLANQLQGLENNLQEVTQLRDKAVQDYQDSVAQQDIIRQEAAENQARQLEEQRNTLLEEREGIVSTLEQDFGVQRSELESLIGNLEGKVGELESVRGGLEGEISNLSTQMQALEAEKQDALSQQDVIRAESAQAQQDALAQQAEEFTGERSALEQQIADLQAQVGQQQAPVDVPGGGGIDYGGGPRKGITPIPIRPPVPPVLPIEKPPMLPPRDDFISYERLPKREILQKPIIPPRRDDFMSIERIEEPRDEFIPRMPNEDRVPFLPPRNIVDRDIPREFIPRMPNEDMVPFVPQPQAPVNPMLPPRKELSGPILGGGLNNPMGRMMMRANGGTISQAIADLQSKIK